MARSQPTSVILDSSGVPMVRNDMGGSFGGSDINFRVMTRHAGLDAGEMGRRMRAVPSGSTTLNSLIRSYGRTIVARSRYLCTNNSYAQLAKEEFISGMVGNGITPAPTTKDIPLKNNLIQVFNDWCDQADADGLLDFYGIQAMVAGEVFEGGECFLRFRTRYPSDGFAIPFQLQVIPTEMLAVEYNKIITPPSPNGNGLGRRIECGIEFDELNRRVAYHFYKVHPGTDLPFGLVLGQYNPVPADEIIHVYKPIRAGQVRGVPFTLASMATLAILDLFDDAELERKRVAALFGAFIERPTTDDQDSPLGIRTVANFDATIDNTPVMEPGATIDLNPGEKVSFSTPVDVGNSYEAFQYRNLLRAAAGLTIPYANMTGDLKSVNYGSIRAGLLTFRRRIAALQRNILIFQLNRKVWNRWLDEAVLAGEVDISPAEYLQRRRELIRVNWTPPRWDWIDPLRDIQAEKLAVDNHFKPRSSVVTEQAFDPVEVDEAIQADQAREQALGNVYPGGNLYEAAPGGGPGGASTGSGGASSGGSSA